MALTRLFVLAVCGIAVSLAADASKEWNYVRSDSTNGPSAWSTHFPQCKLDRNSPINFVDADVERREPESWKLTGWDEMNTWDIIDNHYTVKFSLAGGPITTNGGGLGGQYDVIQFHLHWGSTDSVGSEHTIGGKYYPMEVHFVHKNNRYASINDAVESESDDALGAVGFFFEIQSEDNPQLTKLIDGIKAVRANENSTVAGYSLNALTDALSPSGNFYRYYGGLTTPGCQQIVQWTVFQTPIKISAAQMATIRTQNATSYGEEFYRPVVPVGSRSVILYDTTCSPETCGASASFVSLSLLLVSAAAKYLL